MKIDSVEHIDLPRETKTLIDSRQHFVAEDGYR